MALTNSRSSKKGSPKKMKDGSLFMKFKKFNKVLTVNKTSDVDEYMKSIRNFKHLNHYVKFHKRKQEKMRSRNMALENFKNQSMEKFTSINDFPKNSTSRGFNILDGFNQIQSNREAKKYRGSKILQFDDLELDEGDKMKKVISK